MKRNEPMTHIEALAIVTASTLTGYFAAMLIGGNVGVWAGACVAAGMVLWE